MAGMYQKIKNRNGEKFARTLRDFHDGLLEIPDIDQIVRHAGRDAVGLLPYLMTLLAANEDVKPTPAPQDPFVLLDKAGYNAFHADTFEKQNSIEGYFQTAERLCTFNDRARYQDYYVVHAVRKDVDSILRHDFDGKEERQDAYGTSVISIQIAKNGGFISIKNRYNHKVDGCDNTFNSNPDNIIEGLSDALKAYFNVDFSAPKTPLPEGFALMGNQVFKHHQEMNNTYYGDQAWGKDGVVYTIDKSTGDALFDGYLFDNKTKTLKAVDPTIQDSFPEDFNRCYGGNRALRVKDGNLLLGDDILITAEQSRIKKLRLPELTSMGNRCLRFATALTHLDAPALTYMGEHCLHNARALTYLHIPALISMGAGCIQHADALTHLDAPALTSMGHYCLNKANTLTCLNVPNIKWMGYHCLEYVSALTHLDAPALKNVPDYLQHLIKGQTNQGLSTPKPLKM